MSSKENSRATGNPKPSHIVRGKSSTTASSRRGANSTTTPAAHGPTHATTAGKKEKDHAKERPPDPASVAVHQPPPPLPFTAAPAPAPSIQVTPTLAPTPMELSGTTHEPMQVDSESSVSTTAQTVPHSLKRASSSGLQSLPASSTAANTSMSQQQSRSSMRRPTSKFNPLINKLDAVVAAAAAASVATDSQSSSESSPAGSSGSSSTPAPISGPSPVAVLAQPLPSDLATPSPAILAAISPAPQSVPTPVSSASQVLFTPILSQQQPLSGGQQQQNPASTLTSATGQQQPKEGASTHEARASMFKEISMRSGQAIVVKGKQYVKLDVIGRGGSSKVYKVIGPDLRIFALKRVNLQNTDETTVNSYLNEIALLERLKGNPMVISIIDSEVHPHQRVIDIVLEYGEVDLSTLLATEEGHIDLNTIRVYWQQMLKAVKTIHEERIVHGDLKPANFVMVRGVLKLIDFGIAKQIAGNTTHIERESQIGTLNYISPEALGDLGSGSAQTCIKVSRVSDTWSLGCILYQMAYGKPPFHHLQLMKKVKCIPDPSYVIDMSPRPGVPPALIDVLRRCLQRDPSTRPSLDALLAHPFLTGEPTPFCPLCPHCCCR